MPGWLIAAFWGSLAGSALFIGAGIGYYMRVPPRVTAGIMAFGSGVLISAMAFELMDEAYITIARCRTLSRNVGIPKALSSELLSPFGIYTRRTDGAK